MSKTKAILKPWVQVLAVTRMVPGAVEEYARHHDMGHLLDDPNTPIANIASRIGSGHSDCDVLSEFTGRVCYRAWEKGRNPREYIENIITSRHGNLFAHANVSLSITGVSRSLTHELVRHSVGTNPTQESQRYVSITDDGDINEITVHKGVNCVVPPLLVEASTDEFGNVTREGEEYIKQYLTQFDNSKSAYLFYKSWLKMALANHRYKDGEDMMRKRIAEASRGVMINSTETRLTWTTNLRALFNLIDRRANIHADLEIRRLVVEMYRKLLPYAPLILAEKTDDHIGFSLIKDVDGRDSIVPPMIGV